MSKPQPRRYCYTARPQHMYTKPQPRRYCYTARPQHLYTQPHSRCHCLTTPPNTWTPSCIQDVTSTLLVPTPVHPATSKTLLLHHSSQHLYTQPHLRRYCPRPNACIPNHIQDDTSTPLVRTPVHPATSKMLLPHCTSQHLYTQLHPRRHCPHPNTCTPSHIQCPHRRFLQ